jgi:hypothetical protein
VILDTRIPGTVTHGNVYSASKIVAVSSGIEKVMVVSSKSQGLLVASSR